MCWTERIQVNGLLTTGNILAETHNSQRVLSVTINAYQSRGQVPSLSRRRGPLLISSKEII